MSGLRVETPAEGVAMVVLDRPDRLNAFDDHLLLEALPNTFGELAADRSIRAVVVTGAGGAFSSGADLDCSGFRQPTPVESEDFVRRTHRTPVAVREMPQVTIAAVEGPAVGAGFGLALACDLRLSGPTGRFGAPFVSMGLAPDYGVSYFLPRVAGQTAAIDLLSTGRIVDATEAHGLGLVSRVVDDVVEEGCSAASAIAEHPPAALAMTKRNVYRSLELTLDAEVLEQEVRSQSVALHGSEFAERFARWREQVQGSGAAREERGS